MRIYFHSFTRFVEPVKRIHTSLIKFPFTLFKYFGVRFTLGNLKSSHLFNFLYKTMYTLIIASTGMFVFLFWGELSVSFQTWESVRQEWAFNLLCFVAPFFWISRSRPRKVMWLVSITYLVIDLAVWFNPMLLKAPKFHVVFFIKVKPLPYMLT